VSQNANQPLIDRALAGDETALAELFQRFEPDVGRVCRRMLGSGGAAEDASHEVLLKLRRGLQSYDRIRPFRPWLLGIAAHHCVDQLRRQTTEARLFETHDLDPGDLADPGPSPLRQVSQNQERDAIAGAIGTLPPKYRLPLVLRYFNDQDYDAIAETLGVTRNQVGTLLFRAKRQLRQRLAASRANVVELAERRSGGREP
jgi:RNA polymerase sigma-70 factor (ECF subfamily)